MSHSMPVGKRGNMKSVTVRCRWCSVILVVLGMVFLSVSSAHAGKPRACKGNKKWHKGKCRYPDKIRKPKVSRKKAKKKAAKTRPKSTSTAKCQDLKTCVEQAEKFRIGAGVKKNTRKSLQAAQSACKFISNVSCEPAGTALYNVAMACLTGDGIGRNPAQGNALALAACDSKDSGAACNLLGYGLTMAGHHQEAHKRYVRGCELDSPGACNNAGHGYQVGRGVTKDLEKARFFFKKSCRLGFEPACVRKNTP
jgi:TPR repeat protein